MASVGAVVGSMLIGPAASSEPASAQPASSQPPSSQPPSAQRPSAQRASPPAPDYCGEQCHEILPPGQNGNATLAELAGHQLFGTQPPHSDDQIDEYDDLASGYPKLNPGTVQDFFNDNSFGVPEDQVEKKYQPREDVTVVRDKKAGIPHVYGETRSGTTFGAGYTTAENKLFLMDVLRRAGRGAVTPFAGGAEANRKLEQDFFTTSPYTEQELQKQIDDVGRQGERGKQALADAESYVDGINSYIGKSREHRNFPGEYVATGHVDAVTNEGEIEPFKLTDLVSLAALVGAQFGGGGGNEVQNAVAKMALQDKLGPQRGDEVWKAHRAQNDPEAVSTVHDGRSFPYGGSPDRPEGVAMPDRGSVTEQQLIFDPRGSANEHGTPGKRNSAPDKPRPVRELDTGEQTDALRGIFDDGVVPGDMGNSRGMSNALMVSGEHTESGHPVAAFGPQTSYFAPQLLTLGELQGPGISSKGASFAGLSFYTLLGRGQDYAWSATSANQDITDTFAVRLCEPDGRPANRESDHYLFHGQCLPLQSVERDNHWEPNLGDDTSEGSYRLVSLRTKYGPVTHRATIDGQPVAYTTGRSTFMHEVDSIVGFQQFNDPSAVTSAESFQRAAQDVNYTFNWFYADSRDTAYFNSGDNVRRKSTMDPDMPALSAPENEWQGWDPENNRAAYTPPEQHPNAINQDYTVSWNNKQAPGTTGDKPDKDAVQRGDLLDARVRELTEGGKVDRANLTRAMADAGVTDLRAERVLPDLLRVLESQPVTDPRAAERIDSLKRWLADGGKRVETAPGSHRYKHAEAIELVDAWWPLLVRAEFAPAVGPDAYRALAEVMPVNESPSGWQNDDPAKQVGEGHQGSAFLSGWYGQVSKDVRGVLGEDVPGGFGKPLCGDGDLGACRESLLDSLARADEVPASQTYPGDADCEAGDQWCADAIVHRKIGGIAQDKITWQNRPTYQQVVEFPAHRP